MPRQLFQSYKNLPIPFNRLIIAVLLVSCFFIAKAYTNHILNGYNFPFSWLFIGIQIVINYVLWLVFMPWIAKVSKSLNTRQKVIHSIGELLLHAILISLLHRILATRLYDVAFYLDSGYLREFLGNNGLVALAVGSFSSFIEFLVIFAVFVGANYQKQYLFNQKELIAAQINSLQMQLHPHFLFNTLHSISSMIDIDTRKAQKMLTKIGTMLRTMLESDMEQMTTLKKELEFIRHYLDLEQIRYMDKMHLNFNIDDTVMEAQIPNMILQPLIENAIKYGVVPAVEKGAIKITISKKNNANKNPKPCIHISNTIESNSNSTLSHGTGLGLKNVQQRLEGIYDDNFHFSYGQEHPNLYNVKLGLPLKIEK